MNDEPDDTDRAGRRVGRAAATAGLALGYIAGGLALLAPNVFVRVVGTLPDGAVLSAGYVLTFLLPSEWAIVELAASWRDVRRQPGVDGWTRREMVHVYLAVTLVGRSTHHLLYLLVPLCLAWALVAHGVGLVATVLVWAMFGTAGVGVVVLNRYAWSHDPTDLPAGSRVADS